VTFSDELTSPSEALVSHASLSLSGPLKTFELVELSKVENPLKSNHLKLIAVVTTNIEPIRNALQILHVQVRERMFKVIMEVLRQ
jgi:hypothetical protein